MKSGELRRNSNEGTEENAPRNEAQIVNGRSKVGRARSQRSYVTGNNKQLLAQFRMTRSVLSTKYLNLCPTHRPFSDHSCSNQWSANQSVLLLEICAHLGVFTACSLVLFFALAAAIKRLIYTHTIVDRWKIGFGFGGMTCLWIAAAPKICPS